MWQVLHRILALPRHRLQQRHHRIRTFQWQRFMFRINQTTIQGRIHLMIRMYGDLQPGWMYRPSMEVDGLQEQGNWQQLHRRNEWLLMQEEQEVRRQLQLWDEVIRLLPRQVLQRVALVLGLALKAPLLLAILVLAKPPMLAPLPAKDVNPWYENSDSALAFACNVSEFLPC